MSLGNQVATITEIGEFLSGNGVEPIILSKVPEDIKQSLGATSEFVLMSRYTADKQKKHPEITEASYASLLQEVLDRGERLYDRQRHATIIYTSEKPYLAVLKVTADGKWIFLQSFRRTDDKNIGALKKRIGGG